MNTTTSVIHRGSRRGLAPLELVLALPILLCVMALMVNFGTVASWKVRALGAARNTLWGNRSPRLTVNFLRPTCLPLTANIGVGGLPPAAELDGPRVTLLGPQGNVVPNTDDPNTDVMNPTLELLQGSANLARQFPLLQKLGQYNLTAQTELLDNTWDFQRMGLATNNVQGSFRIPLVYTLAPALNQAAWAQAYSAALWKIVKAIFPSYPNMTVPGPLWPLDRDQDFIFYGQIIQPLFPASSPDFHPVLGGLCSLDTQVADARVQQLIDQIQGKKVPHMADVAERMTRAFIDLYQRAIQAYQAQNMSPPPQLQQNIDILSQFLTTLQ